MRAQRAQRGQRRRGARTGQARARTLNCQKKTLGDAAGICAGDTAACQIADRLLGGPGQRGGAFGADRRDGAAHLHCNYCRHSARPLGHAKPALAGLGVRQHRHPTADTQTAPQYCASPHSSENSSKLSFREDPAARRTDLRFLAAASLLHRTG